MRTNARQDPAKYVKRRRLTLERKEGGAVFWAMDMNRLSPDVKSYIDAQVSEGVYASAEEALDDAVRRMRQEKEKRLTRLRKALAKGEAQLDRGEGREFSPAVMDEILARARKRMGSGKPMDPDVIGD